MHRRLPGELGPSGLRGGEFGRALQRRVERLRDVQITGLNAEGVLLLDTFENGTVGETQVNPDIGFIDEGTFGDRKIIVPEPGGLALIVAALLTLASLKRRSLHPSSSSATP